MQPSLFNKAGVSPAVRILQISQQLRQYPSLGYATAFFTIGLAAAIQWLAKDQYDGAPFLTIYPAVILTTFVGGLGPGLLSGILAGWAQWALFIPTLHWFAVACYTVDATLCVSLIVFINNTLDLLIANIDQEKRAKQHQYILAKELHHRIQNLFTVIQAVIRFSLPGDGLVEKSAIKQRLMDRLQSMSSTNRAITDSMGDWIPLMDLIDTEIASFENQIEVSSECDLVLAPQMTQNLALILHELITNALKHGALSVPKGRIGLALDWKSDVLTLTWQEHDGPPVVPPTTSGFGSQILEKFPKIFSKNVEISYARNGFRYVLQIRSDQVRDPQRVRNVTQKSESAALTKNTDDARPSSAWFGPPVQLERQMEPVLRARELFQAEKSGLWPGAAGVD